MRQQNGKIRPPKNQVSLLHVILPMFTVYIFTHDLQSYKHTSIFWCCVSNEIHNAYNPLLRRSALFLKTLEFSAAYSIHIYSQRAPTQMPRLRHLDPHRVVLSAPLFAGLHAIRYTTSLVGDHPTGSLEQAV